MTLALNQTISAYVANGVGSTSLRRRDSSRANRRTVIPGGVTYRGVDIANITKLLDTWQGRKDISGSIDNHGYGAFSMVYKDAALQNVISRRRNEHDGIT